MASDLAEILPTERRAGLVVLGDAQGRPLLAIVVEVQIGRDQDKSGPQSRGARSRAGLGNCSAVQPMSG
ncbi:hypothetical protein [Chondromyces apiculatus]|uniref:Uncharacterized protein n=1 Tax=Chondromyces apiculatus DSM 436 TaxID=1192034 RepID=A0A017TFH0_9BACT|nr:hypothetical protein [Chondromyces apiculatus]EYF07535.1 Hypothetical protein CAP_8658 [Chondromyces apiculatus DSM 436]